MYCIGQTHFEEIIRYNNGTIKSIITYNANDIKDGPTYNYYSNGNLQSYIPYENGQINGVVENYYKDETLESTGMVINNLATGKFEYYHSNGRPKSTLNYVAGRPQQILGCKDRKGNILYCGPFNKGNGEIYIYEENGTLIAKDHFKNGELIKREIIN